MKWLKEWRLNKLREQLAGVTAAIESELHFSQVTGKYHPAIMANNNKEKAIIEYKINRLMEKLGQ